MSAAAGKLKSMGRSREKDYYSLPLDLTGVFGTRRLSSKTRTVLSVIRGFSVNGKTSNFTYAELAERYHLSRATAGRALRTVRENGRFQQGNRVGEYSYNFDNAEEAKKSYVKVFEWLHFAVVTLDGEQDYLTDNEIHLLSLIRGYSPSGYTATLRHLARRLSISADTVSRGMQRLTKAGLIEIKYPNGLMKRCINGYTRAIFIAKEKAIAKLREGVVKRVKGQSATVKAANEATERDRYYQKRRNEESLRIDKIKEKIATEEPAFLEIEKDIRILEKDIGKAQAQGGNLRELLQRRTERKRQWRACLERLGYTEVDLEPRYICADCKDTGYRKDGTFCDCWGRRS